MSLPVAFFCSPRAGGNSDAAGSAFVAGVEQAGGAMEVVRLRELCIDPCVGCGICAKGPCPLVEGDQAEEHFAKLMAAPFVFFASPIYFYHVPAQFKAFIDRSQAHYERREAGSPALTGLPMRPVYTAMVCGRPQGEKLFSGSLLTLKYFLKIFNLEITQSLGFRGKDAPGDMAGDAQAMDEARAMGANAWAASQR